MSGEVSDDTLASIHAAVKNRPKRRRTPLPRQFESLTHEGGPSVSDVSTLAPLLAVSGRHAPRLQRAMAYAAAGQMAWDYGRRAYGWWSERRKAAPQDVYTIIMPEDENTALALMRYVVSKNTFANERALLLESREVWDEDASRWRSAVFLRPDEEVRPLEFEVDGHPCTVIRQYGKPGQEDSDTPPEARGYDRSSLERFVVVSCQGAEAFVALRAFVQSLIPKRDNSDEDEPSSDLYTWMTARDWYRTARDRRRSIDSVVLREGQVESVLDDVRTFLALEREYADYGATWRRGLLIYGRPGGGKTSLITAVASHLGLDVYYLSLRSIKNNDELERAIGMVQPRSIILFEDVDVVAPTRHGAGHDSVSLDGLLNVMDGMLTPHGAIFVLTTNDVDSLDPALIRPGRIDVRLHVDYLDDAQTARMAARFFGRPVELPAVQADVMPAELAGIFKRHLHDREAAYPEVVELLRRARAT